MSLPHILLGLLREPASGYDLKAEFDQSIRHFWSAELSQIYPMLKRLEKDGWLESHSEPSERGPERKVYSLTDQGRGELRAWLSAGPEVGTERFAYLAQLFFMAELEDPAATHSFMTALRARLAAWLARLEAVEAEIATHSGFPDDLPDELLHAHITLRMGLHSLRAKLAWCDESLARLEKRAGAQTGTKTALAATAATET